MRSAIGGTTAKNSTVADHRPGELRASSTRRAEDSVPCTKGCHPLSFAQKRLWFLDRLHPGSPVYTIAVAVRLRGPLNVVALRRAIAAVEARHEVLRARVVCVEGEPCQELALTSPLNEIAIVDLGEAELRGRLQEEAQRPFDLSIGPMLRTVLFRLGTDEHVLFVGMHHIASDWFSFGIFFRELSRHYQAFPNLAELPPLRLQYADYSAAQVKRLTSDGLRPSLEYWRKELTDAPELIELPSNRPRPATPSFRGERRERQLPAALSSALQNLSRREGVTPFMLLLAAFNAFLYRLTHQEDILVGTPITGRNRAGTDQLIGFFSNTVVLRSLPTGDGSFCELLGQVRAKTLGAMNHLELPFERLVEELRPDRTLNHTPLFQTMFTMQNAWANEIVLPGVEARVEVLDTGTAKFDFTLAITTARDAWTTEMEFSSDLFDPATIDRWFGNFETLLAGIAANPELPLDKLPLLTDAERRRVLFEWNNTGCDFQSHRSVSELFEQQARERPDATAIVFGSQQLTYRDVDRRANQLAHHLRSRGIGLVGICLERNPQALISMLAVLKAGGAFLHMDATDPLERLRFIIDDAQVSVILTQEKFKDRFSSGSKVVCLDALDVGRAFPENPAPPGDPESLAYVIYTSGSTGKAKGVQISRRSLLNHSLAIGRIYELMPADRVMQFAALNFDVSIEEILPSWLHGSAVVLRSEEALASIPNFLDFVEREKITVLNLPTAFWHAIVEALPGTAIPRCVRLMIIGGEKASITHYRTWKQHVGERIKLINAYGLTEATITSTVYVSTADDRCDVLPIGRPIANTQTVILDRTLQPAPIGVVGELYIGGEGVACGYLNRAQLTDERFVQSPFENMATRLYRTGDLARWLPDGNIEFIGRADHQMKLRGFRIELGEIEAQLRLHDQVRDAVVVAREDGAEKTLVGYVVARVALTIPELRDHLKKHLPDYMIPAAFVLLDHLPLTSNGKVDRRALPAPVSSVPHEDGRGESAPRTETEQVLSEIWCNLLHVPQVGIHDNYFRLGGHSLLAIRLVSRIEEAFQIEVPMSTIFEAPTVAELASRIESQIMREIEELSDDEAAAALAGQDT